MISIMFSNETELTNQRQLDEFMSSLAQRLERMIEKVVVIPLYGRSSEFGTIADAIKFLDQHRIYEGSGEFRRYEVLVTFTNGDRVEGSFKDKVKVKVREFLQFIEKQ
ncbi:MAG: hypothetical protein Q8M86_06795 [Syntrophales bacterium]|nr:hypothetical protein [Syntrophales bacterium]